MHVGALHLRRFHPQLPAKTPAHWSSGCKVQKTRPRLTRCQRSDSNTTPSNAEIQTPPRRLTCTLSYRGLVFKHAGKNMQRHRIHAKVVRETAVDVAAMASGSTCTAVSHDETFENHLV